MKNELLTTKSELETVEKSILQMPALKDLSAEQLEEIAKLVVVQNYTQEMKRDVDLMKFNYSELKETFLQTVSGSKNTKCNTTWKPSKTRRKNI